MNLQYKFTTPAKCFSACEKNNGIVFYKYDGNKIGIWNRKEMKILYEFNFGMESVIRNINWSDLGDCIVIVTNMIIVFNVYSKKIEFRYLPDRLKLKQAFLLKNRKLMIENCSKSIQLISYSSQIEYTYHYDYYTRTDDRIFFVLNGVLNVLDLNFETIFCKMLSFNSINLFEIYKRKVYFVDKNQIMGIDYVFHLEEKIDNFQITKKYIFVEFDNQIYVYEKHTDKHILRLDFLEYWIEKKTNIIFCLNKNIFYIYKPIDEDLKFQMIQKKIEFKEQEHEFDLSDEMIEIP